MKILCLINYCLRQLMPVTIESKCLKGDTVKLVISTVASLILLPCLSFVYDAISTGLSNCAQMKAFFDNSGLTPQAIASFVLAGIVLLLVLLYYYIVKHITGTKRAIIDTAIARADQTGIFLISKKCPPDSRGITNDVEVLVRNERNKYVPYLDLSEISFPQMLPKKLRERKETEKIRKVLANELNLGTSNDIITVEHIHYTDSIKPSRVRQGNQVKLIMYNFYRVAFTKDVEKTILDGKKYKWERLSKLEGDPDAQFYNHDVINQIRVLFSDNLLFDESIPNRKQIKIIWNIADTSNCPHNCPICATYRKNPDKSIDKCGKALILQHILGMADKIKEIDFSGGDPLLEEMDRQVILDTIAILGNDRVSVTTTQKGIHEAYCNIKDIDKLKKLLYKCELSLDIDNPIRSFRGNYSNGHKDLLSDREGLPNRYIKDLVINIPILDTSLEDDQIKHIVDTVCSFPNRTKSVHLLRLMEVGRQEKMSSEQLQNYNNGIRHIIETFLQYANGRIKVKLHCALRGLNNPEYICNMRDEKIGIDSVGNVFSCAWGGYLQIENIKDNPFYLGNLLENDLETILSEAILLNKKQIPAMDFRPPRSCCIYSYNHFQSDGPFAGKDPLFQEQNDG